MQEESWSELADDTFSRLSESGLAPEEARIRATAIMDDTKSFAEEVEAKLLEVPEKARPLWPRGMSSASAAALQKSMRLIQSTATHAYWERLMEREMESRAQGKRPAGT